jgi:hypothetical protein
MSASSVIRVLVRFCWDGRDATGRREGGEGAEGWTQSYGRL